MNEVMSQIESFAKNISLTKEIESEQFAASFHNDLLLIDRAANKYPDEVPALKKLLLDMTESEFSSSKIISHGRNKPYGYSGDFQIIDWTYLQTINSATERGQQWDRFYHSQVAPKAVRSRKERFGIALKEVANRFSHRPLRILNVGSGPAREILDGAEEAGLKPSDLYIECVDQDINAIEYAQNLLGGPWSESVHFVKRNALRYRPKAEFHLAWSSGLFDYFNHRLAVRLMTNMFESIIPNGIIQIGNFADTHSTRPWIEWCGDWHLIHRSRSDMEKIAIDALELKKYKIQCSIDKYDAVRFLIITKSS